MFCVSGLVSGVQQLHQYALNTRNHFTHSIYINFPDHNVEHFADLNSYADTIMTGLQKIPGIKEAQLQKVSAPFVDQYAYQMIVDIIISDELPNLMTRLSQFCNSRNLILQGVGECPVFAEKVNFFIMLIGLVLIAGILYFFMTLLNLALFHERQKIHTLQLMGAPSHMIGLLFSQEVRRLIIGMGSFVMLIMCIAYGIVYWQTPTKVAFWQQHVLYLNTVVIPLSVGLFTYLLTRVILYRGVCRF